MTKVLYKGNYKVDPKQHASIARLYASGDFTVEYIAKTYGLSLRQIQRIATKFGVIRTQAEANRVAAPLKHYHHIPAELKVKRKQLSQKTRFQVISGHPFCTVCGMRPGDGIRLEVDHIDENPANNELSNLQVLCGKCNAGKSHIKRFPS